MSELSCRTPGRCLRELLGGMEKTYIRIGIRTALDKCKSKSIMRYHFTPIMMMAIIKHTHTPKNTTQKITSVGEAVDKLKPLCFAGYNIK